MLLLNSDNIESHGFGNWSALPHSDDVSNSRSFEAWSEMGGNVVMSLLESIVFLDVVQVISSQYHSSGHLG